MKCAGYRLPDPKWQGPLRSCCKCKLIDAPLYAGELDDDMKPVFTHRVVIDLVFIDRTHLTDKERAQGYAFMTVGDRKAKVRMMCRPCLEHEEQTREAWADFKQQQKRDAEQGENNYYAQLCSE